MTTGTASSNPAEFDIIFVTDTRFSGGTSSSLTEELLVASRVGYRVGLVHLSSTRLGTSATVHPGIRQLVEHGAAELVLPGQPVRTTLAIVKHPTVFAVSLGGELPIEAEQVVVAVGQVPRDDAGEYYDAEEVDANIREAIGCQAIWWPVSDAVRATLTGVELAEDNWDEIIDIERWRQFSTRRSTDEVGDAEEGPLERSAPDGPRPIVIGRHSRPNPSKWPGTVDELTAAYPIDGSVEVRVLGGADPASVLLGGTPESWTVLPFGAQEPAVFLAGLDALVYYHHRDMVEAFGRTVLEALAVGIPVVVSPVFESTFGQACLYAEPIEAIATVRRLVLDPVALERQLAIADRVLRARFSYAAYRERIARLIGPPAERPIGPAAPVPPAFGLIPPGQRDAHRVELIVALGETTQEVADVLEHLGAHRRQLPGFIPIVVMTCARPAIAASLGIETVVITSRRKHSDPSESWETFAHRRIRQIANSFDVDDIGVTDVRRPDAWIALQQRRRRSIRDGSR